MNKGRHGHRKRGPVSRFFRNIQRYFREVFVSGSAPKEYRPYLGPAASDEEIEAKTYVNPRTPDQIRKKIAREKRRRLSSLFSFRTIQEKIERSRHERKKRNYKRKVQQRLKRAERKENRIQFIRRYFPGYKKIGGLDLDYTAVEGSAEPGKLKTQSSLTYLVNSTILFIIAHLLVYMIYQFTVLFMAAGWRIDSVLFYYDLAFNDFSPLWFRTNIIIVTLSGPVISIIIGFIFLRFFAIRANLGKHTRLFFLWIGLHGFNLFLGAFASGVSFDEGFGYVAAWLYLNMFWKILFSLTFLFLLGVIGYYAAPRFLDTSYSLTRIKPENRFKFLLYQAFLPWIIGTGIILLVKIPNNLPYDTGNLITLVFAVVPLIFNRKARPSKLFTSEKRPNQIKWFVLGVMVILMLVYRLGLNDGLHIKLFYRFSFSLDITPL
ncbi:MAG: hypothetical protein ACNA7V_01795 [Bacteroidales bacterium]